MTYADKLNDPRWIIMSTKAIRRDKFRCQGCGILAEKPEVHHRCYIPSREPWDYDLSDLVTYCPECHRKAHNRHQESGEIIGINYYCKNCRVPITNDQAYGRNSKREYYCERCVAEMEEELIRGMI